MTDKAKLYVVKNDKGEFLSFYSSHESVWYTNNPTFFNDKSYAEVQAGPYGHVVELVEAPAKVVVSEDMASWLSDAKEMRMPIEFLARCKVPDSDQEDMLRAYVNGWEVEKPKLWNIKVPRLWNVKVSHVSNGYYYKDIDGLAVFTATPHSYVAAEFMRFTDAEIKHYGLQDCEKEEVKTNG